jgi:CBS-domain-containing membrane protein
MLANLETCGSPGHQHYPEMIPRGTRCARDLMVAWPVTVAPQTVVTEARALMQQRRLIGILTRTDILRAFCRLHNEIVLLSEMSWA